MASFDTLQKLQQHPEWLPPRSDLRVFLGESGAPEATKTTVEPGNTFSPGMMTFGVTWWLRFPENGRFFAPEVADLSDLVWSYEEGYLPIIHCQTRIYGIEARHSLFQDGTYSRRSEAVCARLTLTNQSDHMETLQVFIALRSLGPAGGEVKSLMVGDDRASLWNEIRQLPYLGVDQQPTAAGCGVGDPVVLARHGQVPGVQSVKDNEGWCFGLFRFDVRLKPGDTWQVSYDCPLQTIGPVQDLLPGPGAPLPGNFDQRLQQHKAVWKERFNGIHLEVPDEDFRNAFFAGIQHLLTAMVGDQPRIAVLSYPLPWLRDSVFIVRCLDLAGFHEQARSACNFIARNDFFGGFGAEGDAPGEGLWALVEHYRINRDRDWLEEVYPAIQRKAQWLRRMRTAQNTIQVFQDAPTLAFTHAHRTTGIICLPAKDGLIQGTMDFGVDYSLGWVNQWAICGLREAAFAARELGRSEDADAFSAEADDLLRALQEYTLDHPAFFEHDRTTNSLLWPTQAWAGHLDLIRDPFNRWWDNNRGDGDHFKAEPYWLYFEEAQAHNALLMGQRERAWTAMDYRLRHQDLPGLFGWREGGEGVGTENAVRGVTLIPFLRGCHKFDSITPHGWSQAEMWLLQRAMLVEEWNNGLLLFAGVPKHWLTPGARITVGGFSTAFGRIDASLIIAMDGKNAEIEYSGINQGTGVEIRLPGMNIPTISDGGVMKQTMVLK